MVALVTLLDYSKAYETINQELLLNGGCQSEVFWFRHYLSDRIEMVKVGNAISTEILVVYGAPQGSILVRILFILYTADPESVLPFYICQQHADDTQFCASSIPGDNYCCGCSEHYSGGYLTLKFVAQSDLTPNKNSCFLGWFACAAR